MKIALAITGASGAIYAQRILFYLEKYIDKKDEVGVVISDCGKQVWEHELGSTTYKKIKFNVYAKDDFNAPFASGSAGYDCMIVCPCTMGTMGRIASGISNDLITRTADVMLKERKRLLLVTREMPYNLIHIENMRTVTLAGGIVCPASPSFYSKPTNEIEMVDTVILKVLQLAGFKVSTFEWGK